MSKSKCNFKISAKKFFYSLFYTNALRNCFKTLKIQLCNTIPETVRTYNLAMVVIDRTIEF